MRHFVSLLLFLPGFSVSAQTLSGTIRDNSGHELSGVVILDQLTHSATLSDSTGHFQLSLAGKTAQLQFRLNGFYPQTFAVQQLHDTTFSVKMNAYRISSGSLTKSNSTPLYNPSITITDFAFAEGGLLLLTREGGRDHLVFETENDSLLSQITLGFRGLRLYHDCFGKAHVLSADSSYQVAQASKNILLLPPFSIARFREQLEPCIADRSRDMIQRSFGPHRQSLTYTSVDKRTHTRQNIVTIQNADIDPMAANAAGNFRASDPSAAARSLRSHPAYHPLFVMRDSLYVFDFSNDSLRVFDHNGVQRRSVHFSAHYAAGWMSEIIYDEVQQRFYVDYFNEGETFLCEINLLDGTLKPAHRLHCSSMPVRLEVHHGIAWLTVKTDRAQQLFREAL